MSTIDDDIVHLYERCVDVFGRWAAMTLMRMLGPPAHVLDRRLGITWRHADVDRASGPSEVIGPHCSAPDPGTAEFDHDALSLFATLIDVLGRRAAVTLVELLQPPVADALDRRLTGWRDLAVA